MPLKENKDTGFDNKITVLNMNPTFGPTTGGTIIYLTLEIKNLTLANTTNILCQFSEVNNT